MKGSIKPVPWDERFLQVLITMRKEQENWGVIEDPSDVDPRNILKKVMAQFQSLGLKPVVAFELEFYLLDKNRDENGKPVPAGGANKTHVYGIPDLDLFGRLFDDINKNCEMQNIPATTASSEFAAGQYEINLKHTDDLLKAADDAAMLRKNQLLIFVILLQHHQMLNIQVNHALLRMIRIIHHRHIRPIEKHFQAHQQKLLMW